MVPTNIGNSGRTEYDVSCARLKNDEHPIGAPGMTNWRAIPTNSPELSMQPQGSRYLRRGGLLGFPSRLDEGLDMAGPAA